MTIHYHGTPITPRAELYKLAGRHFCVSHADPRDVVAVHGIGQSVMLDNGAFSAWTAGNSVDWDGYYRWCDKWLAYPTTWAVIPDVIDGSEKDNDKLIEEWPHGDRGAPVWHMHESIERLIWLCADFHRICIGSSDVFAVVGTKRWHRRMGQVFDFLAPEGRVNNWVHMLRGMSLSGDHYPFASLDSTDVARNHNRPQNSVVSLADRWDSAQCAPTWSGAPEQEEIPCG